MTMREATRNPIYGVLSGPSGGVAGALFVARKAGFDNILTFDMGGTSTDVALCQNGQPTIGRETSIGQFRIKVPSVSVHTVGAGGGSIAHVPELTKALRVGPQSAGAEPGPAAYGKGGDAPTVTDANVVLGYLPPKLLGGEMELDVEKARAAVQTIADAMGLPSAEEAAEGIVTIVNENMAGALRARLRAARPRPPRVRACRLRRRRASSRERHGSAHGLLPGDRPARARAALRDRRPRGRLPRRVRPDLHPRAVGRRPARSRLDPRDARRARFRVARGARESRRRRAASATSPTCATTGRATRSRWRSTPPRRANGLGELEERFNRLHEQLYGFRMPGTDRRSSISGRSASGRCRSRSCPRERPARTRRRAP